MLITELLYLFFEVFAFLSPIIALCGVGGGLKKTIFFIFAPLGFFTLPYELDLVSGALAPSHVLRKAWGSVYT